MVEGVVANHIEKAAFWRSPQNDEIDIVAKESGRLVPIEIKYQSQITKNDLKPMIKFAEKFKTSKGMIVTKNTLEKQTTGGMEILLIPAWLFLLMRDA